VTRREWWVLIGGASALATLGLVLALNVRPSDANLAVEAFLLFAGALAMMLIVRATARLFPPQTDSRIERRGRPRRKEKRLGELVRIERELEMATQSAFDTHYRLRPLLRELAATRLARHGVARPRRLGARPPRPRPSGRAPRRRRRPRDRRPRRHRPGAALVSVDLGLEDVGRVSARILDEVERAVVGKRDALELVLLGMLADGHILIEDFPGLAKTLIARSFAQVASMDFRRIQFTPDLMPADVTGSSIFDQRASDFDFRPGPIFTNLLLADEINRAPPKTQAALLEAMQERQVTIEGITRSLARPFLVLATQNPIEYEGTYPLPEAQLDRFLLRIGVGYPSREDEWGVLEARIERREDEVELEPVVDAATLVAMQRAVESVHVAESVGYYVVDVVAATRTSPSVQVGASPRGSLAVMKLARCKAVLEGRDYVTPEDVKFVAVPALAHRLTLRPELWVQRVRAEDIVAERLETVPTPRAEDVSPSAAG
jgi:MoxR-like ATPase